MAVHQVVRALRDWLRPSPSRQPKRKHARLELQPLEDRCTPANATGTIAGFVFVDNNGNGVRDTGEVGLPGIRVTLSGRTDFGVTVNVTAKTSARGSFQFQNVQPGGNYVLRSTSNLLIPTTRDKAVPRIGGGQTVSASLAFQGLSATAVSLRQFLASTVGTRALQVLSPPGSGVALATSRPNDRPTVKTAIANVTTTTATTRTLLDLAANFDDPNIANSRVQFITNRGNFNVDLFDKQAPQTVTNFLNYVNANDFDASIFHRLVSNFVLQGGGFRFKDTAPIDTPKIHPDNPNNPTPTVKNEFGRANTRGTVAMAKLDATVPGGGPDSATDQFFFNLANNTSLNTQNGGFTVFGQLSTQADIATVDSIARLTIQNRSSFNSAFGEIPLSNYTGTNFPRDTTASNFALVRDIRIVSQPEKLVYSVIRNTNPALVTPTFLRSNNGSVNSAQLNNRLNLVYNGTTTGTATITVRATDRFGSFVDSTFTVTRNTP